MPGQDSLVVSLLHGNGADASTTITDQTGKTWTANGNAQIDTAQSKFGGASILFDGTGDFITADDSNDWQLDGGSDSNTWTVDFWVRFNGDPGAAIMGFLQQRVDNNNFWAIYLNSNALWFRMLSGGVAIVSLNNAWNPGPSTWYHVAVVKNGTTGYMMFIDGTQIGTTQTDTSPMPNFAGGARIGLFTDASGGLNYFNGWLDEFRISKGSARWTTTFTPPTEEYGWAQAVAGSLSSVVGALTKKTSRSIAAAISSITGALTYTRLIFKSVSGVISNMQGSLSRRVAYARALSGTLTMAGSLATRIIFFFKVLIRSASEIFQARFQKGTINKVLFHKGDTYQVRKRK